MPIVPEKSLNKGRIPAEMTEGRGVAEGNTGRIPAPRTQSWVQGASLGLGRIREAA